MNSSLEELLIEKLLNLSQTLSTAESCTGGLVAHRLTNVSGASAVFRQGFITYSNESKIKLLNVPSIMLEHYGAVSPEVAAAMAEGVIVVSGTTFGLATTGIAGPTGATPTMPVGTLFLAIAQEAKETIVWRELFSGERLSFKEKAVESLFKRFMAINSQ